MSTKHICILSLCFECSFHSDTFFLSTYPTKKNEVDKHYLATLFLSLSLALVLFRCVLVYDVRWVLLG